MKWVLNIAALRLEDGGPANAVLRTAEQLALGGHDVSICFPEVDERDRPVEATNAAVRAGVKLYGVRIRRMSRARLSLAQVFTSIRLGRGADVVTCHGFYQGSCVAAFASAVVNGANLWIQPHGVFEPYQEQRSARSKKLFMHLLGSRITRRASLLVAASTSEKFGIIESLPKSRPNVRVLGLGVVDPGPRKRPENLESNSRPTVLFLSRIAPKKRLDVLIEACRLSLGSETEFSLTVAGSGEEGLVQKLMEQAEGLPIDFVGQVSGDYRRQIEEKCTILVLPSENENFGQTVTEAMVRGIPVIATRATASSEHVLKADAGWVISQPDAKELRETLSRALSNIDELGRKGLSGRVYAISELTWAQVAERWILEASAPGRSDSTNRIDRRASNGQP